MRCLACNAILTDYESTRKNKAGEFIDLCSNCITPADVAAENEALKHESDILLDTSSDDE